MSFNFSHNDTMMMETIIIIMPSSIRPIENYVYHRTETLCHSLPKPSFLLVQIFGSWTMKLFVSINSPVFINTNNENSISETDVLIFR